MWRRPCRIAEQANEMRLAQPDDFGQGNQRKIATQIEVDHVVQPRHLRSAQAASLLDDRSDATGPAQVGSNTDRQRFSEQRSVRTPCRYLPHHAPQDRWQDRIFKVGTRAQYRADQIVIEEPATEWTSPIEFQKYPLRLVSAGLVHLDLHVRIEESERTRAQVEFFGSTIHAQARGHGTSVDQRQPRCRGREAVPPRPLRRSNAGNGQSSPAGQLLDREQVQLAEWR